MSTTTPPNKSRYVGSLAPTVTKDSLQELCAKFGFKNVSVHVVMDPLTRKSRGYGYLNFEVAEEAEKCHQAINYRDLEGSAVRVMPVDRNRYKTAKQHKRNLFIKTLDPKITERQLYDTLTRYFGTVDSVRIIRDKAGESKGRGFVQFETGSAADTCFEKLQGLVVGDKAVELERYSPKTKNPDSFNNTFIRDLPEECTDEMLKNHFAKAGAVSSVKTRMTDDSPEVPSKCAGFGYVAFETHEAAQAAIDEFNNKKLTNSEGEDVGEQVISVERFVPKSKRDKARVTQRREGNLYVRSFPENWTEDDLKKEFSQYGEILSARVMKRESGESQRFGFVCFKQAESRKNALVGAAANNSTLFVAPAKSKKDRDMEKRRQNKAAAINNGNLPFSSAAQQYNVSPAQLQMLFNQFMTFMTSSMQPARGPMMGAQMGQMMAPNMIPVHPQQQQQQPQDPAAPQQ